MATKILSYLVIALMVLHMIKPLGLPGLKKRSDFWKIAAAALVIMGVTVLISH